MNADADISPLSQKFRGSLIGPSDPNYDDARALYNGMIHKRPLRLRVALGTADVIAAVDFGRAPQGLRLAVAISRRRPTTAPGIGGLPMTAW